LGKQKKKIWWIFSKKKKGAKFSQIYTNFFSKKFQLLLPQANGLGCVDFGCTHPIDGLFWNLPIYLLGFFSKYECWVTDSMMALYHFIFLGLSLAFLYDEVSYHYEM
jgi:hypothetical protein